MTGARYLVAPGGRIEGVVTVPGDKSISHRALMLGAVAQGDTRIDGFLDGEDCLCTLRALESMGVGVERNGAHEVHLRGVGLRGLRAPAGPLDMGNAGTAMRLFMGLLAAQPFESTLVGDASLMRRPMERVAAPLRSMGARIDTRDGVPPVHIQPVGRLTGIEYRLPVASAQLKSAVLLAGLQAAGSTSVIEPAPSRDHTERMLAQFGISLQRSGATISLRGGQSLRGAEVRVPADFSSAAFFLVAGCLAPGPGVVLRRVGVNPTRTGLLELLRRMGADIEVRPEAGGDEPVADIHVRPAPLKGIDVPGSLVPLAIDEFPAFFIAAACARGQTTLSGAAELRVKESDRLAGMSQGLTTLGVENELLGDGIRIRGREELEGGVIDSRGDHRIAMAFSIAALKAQAPIEILDVANVATSFPGFPQTARQAGLRIESA